MKMKKFFAAATVLSLCANMAVCGSTSRAADNQSEENKNVTLCETGPLMQAFMLSFMAECPQITAYPTGNIIFTIPLLPMRMVNIRAVLQKNGM